MGIYSQFVPLPAWTAPAGFVVRDQALGVLALDQRVMQDGLVYMVAPTANTAVPVLYVRAFALSPN